MSCRHRTLAGRTHPRRAARPRLEPLEDRVLLAVDWVGLAAGLDQHLAQLDGALSNLPGAGVDLPVLDQPLSSLQDVQGFVDAFRTTLVNAFLTPANQADAAALRDGLAAVLMSAGVLGDTNGDTVIDANDVNVSPFDADSTGVDVSFRLTRVTDLAAGEKVGFGLGLPGVPLEVETQGSVGVAVTVDYADLSFGIHNGNFAFDPSQDQGLKVAVGAYLENLELTGMIGFLNLKATDAGPADSPEFAGEFAMTVTGSAAVTGVQLTGGVNLDLLIEAGFGENTAYSPSISTVFHMDWGFTAEGDLAALDASFGDAEPNIQFQDVTLRLGSFVSDLIGPAVGVIQVLTEPVAPLFKLLDSALPVLSASPIDGFLDQNGDGDVSIVDLANLAADVGLLPPPYDTLVKLATVLIDVTNLVQDIDGLLDGDAAAQALGINFGSFDLGNQAADLREIAQAAGHGDPTAAEWSSLVPHYAGTLDLDGVQAQITQVFDGAGAGVIGDKINELIDKVQKTAENGIDLTFPLFGNPASGVFQLLLGKDVDLVSFSAVANLYGEVELASIPVGPVEIALGGALSLESKFRVAYDTYGFRQVLAGKGPEYLADGLYLDTGSKFDFEGTITGGLSVGFGILSGSVKGQVSASLHLSFDDAKNQANNGKGLDGDPSRLRIFDGGQPGGEFGNCLLVTHGGISGALLIGVEVGVEFPPPVGFVGVEFSTTLLEGEIINLDNDCLNPFAAPPKLAEQVGSDLVLNLGPRAGCRVGDKAADPNNPKDSDGNEKFVLGGVADQPQLLTVTAFGFTETYDVAALGITRVVGAGGHGNDQVKVEAQAPGVAVQLFGDDPNDASAAGKDQLTYLGTGVAELFGGPDDDVLVGGAGTNYLQGEAGNDTLVGGLGSVENHLGHATLETGHDVLVGGTGKNFFWGGPGDDEITAASPAGDVAHGNAGHDNFLAGPGNDQLFGDEGDDNFVWEVADAEDEVTDGNTHVEGGPGLNQLGLIGADTSGQPDTFVLTGNPATGLITIAAPDGRTLQVQDLEKLGIEGRKGADTITVHSLAGTRVRQVGINLSDQLHPDQAEDDITVNARAVADTLTVETVEATIQITPGPKGPRGEETEIHEKGGVMSVSGVPIYTVYAMNYGDDLLVRGLGGPDTLHVKSITGHTTVEGNNGNDTMHVSAAKPTVGATPGDYLDVLDVNAGPGTNTFLVDESASVIGDTLLLTTVLVTSTLLPEVNYVATGGNYAGGVTVLGGPHGDTINVRATRVATTTSILSGGGDDLINVGTEAPAAGGHLGVIRGTFVVDAGSGSNNILKLDDRGAAGGNAVVLVGPNQLLGFAGPSDNTPVQFAATGGQLDLVLEGGDHGQAENYLVLNPNASLTLRGHGGTDRAYVLGLVQPALVAGGAGPDVVHAGILFNNLAVLQAPLTVQDGPGGDQLFAYDQSAPSGQAYTLTATSLHRPNAGLITFDATLEQLAVGTSAFADVFTVVGLPLLTAVSLNAGNDTVVGPNQANTWQLTANQAGTLNGKLLFVGAENLTGGGAADAFFLANGVGLPGTINGQGGVNTLDYSAYTTPVVFNLAAGTATNLGGFASIQTLVGGKASDLLRGGNGANLWQLTGPDQGQVASANATVAFSSVESLQGGAAADTFQLHPGAGLSGTLNGQGGVNALDYSPRTTPVQVDLAAGSATGVAGGVSNVVNVRGGSGDDLLFGNNQGNVLRGGPGNDILVGRDGADQLFGEAGFDFLIGGAGADELLGGGGGDLLIAGTTQYDADPAALRAIRDAWAGPGSYDERVFRLRTGVGVNNAVRLTTATVFDDQGGNVLTGGLDDDWFWANVALDLLTDLVQPPERVK